MVGRRERASRDAVEALQRIAVAVGRAVLEDQATTGRRGSGPSCGSVALPANWITSPTRHVVPGDGRVIVAVGGVLPTVIVTAAVAERRGCR